MVGSVQTQPPKLHIPGYLEAWDMVVAQLRLEMSKVLFETWVQPLHPLGYQAGIFRLSAYNSYAREWVEKRLKSRITHLLESFFNEPVKLQLIVTATLSSWDGGLGASAADPRSVDNPLERPEKERGDSLTRKVVLQRAYGSERARVIQPERGMFVTLYFFNEWLPLLGHSAFATILAARSMCYWNPMTGELRNTVDTDMSELARRAAVSVRTVKDVLNNDLVQRYFLRYLVRRMMTPNGIRTAGISMQVRMDDPLTPQDQAACGLPEELQWYSVDYAGEEEEE